MLANDTAEPILCTDPGHDRGCRCQDDSPPLWLAPVEVWCHKCDQPATRAIVLTLGEARSYCDQHSWLILAPRGRH